MKPTLFSIDNGPIESLVVCKKQTMKRPGFRGPSLLQPYTVSNQKGVESPLDSSRSGIPKPSPSGVNDWLLLSDKDDNIEQSPPRKRLRKISHQPAIVPSSPVQNSELQGQPAVRCHRCCMILRNGENL